FISGVLITIRVEGVAQTSLETSKARCLVLDHVVVTGGVYRTKGSTHICLQEAGAKGATNTRHIQRANCCLTTKGQLTPVIPSKTKVSFTTKQAVITVYLTLLLSSSSNIKTALELEDKTQAITQVFGTSQTPAVTTLNTAEQAGACSLCTTVLGVTFDTLITDTTVNYPVQGYRCFCLRDASKADHQSSSEQCLFH